MEFLKEYLPESFNNVVIDVSFEPNLHFQSLIRSNVLDLQDCDAWVAEFGKNTKTKWNVRNSKPQASRFVCRKKYVCHHSDFQKKPNEGIGRKSKNFSCGAFINIRVKSTTSDTKKKDKYVRDGLPAIITMNNYHSHDIVESAALSYLPPSDEIHSQFETYFNDGLGLREAIEVHEAKLQLLGVANLMDTSLNPRYDTVKYWLANWRKANLLPQEEDTDQCDKDFESGFHLNSDREKRKFQELIDLMQMQNERFGSSQSLLQKVIKRLKVVNSEEAWHSFLNGAGNNLIARTRHRNSNQSFSFHEDSIVDVPQVMSRDMPRQSMVYIVKATVDNSSFDALSNGMNIKMER